jgi:hypothetical protein
MLQDRSESFSGGATPMTLLVDESVELHVILVECFADSC